MPQEEQRNDRGLPADEFRAVLARARDGHERAWTRLYDAYVGLVAGYLRSRGAPDVDDLTGEVFLKVVRSLDTFSGGEADFRSWLLTVTHHALVDAWRRDGRRPEEPTPREELTGMAGAPGGGSRAIEQLTTEEIAGLLAGLTDDQRQVLGMRLASGLSTREIAGIVGQSRGAGKQLQRRAIAQLRRLLDDDPYPIEPPER